MNAHKQRERERDSKRGGASAGESEGYTLVSLCMHVRNAYVKIPTKMVQRLLFFGGCLVSNSSLLLLSLVSLSPGCPISLSTFNSFGLSSLGSYHEQVAQAETSETEAWKPAKPINQPTKQPSQRNFKVRPCGGQTSSWDFPSCQHHSHVEEPWLKLWHEIGDCCFGCGRYRFNSVPFRHPLRSKWNARVATFERERWILKFVALWFQLLALTGMSALAVAEL